MITKSQADQLVEKYDTLYKKELLVNGKKLWLYNYIFADYQMFQDEPLSKELRGLVITEEPQQVFLSVPKFFNINETNETQFNNIKHLKIRKVQNKLDGSLITPILIDGSIIAKSKASFESPQAKLAQEIIDSSSNLKFFILDLYDNKFQPFFELIGPNNPCVIKYQQTQLRLIMVRDSQGNFIDVDKFDYEYTVESCNYTWDELIDKQQNKTGIEGWVVKYGNEKIVKVKTKEFFELHKIHEESESYKILLKRTLDEDMDDILSIIPEYKQEKIKTIMKVLSDYVVNYVIEIESIINQNLPRYEVVKKYKSHKYFSVIMRGLDGKNVKSELIKSIKKKYRKEHKSKEFINTLLNN